MAGKFSENGIIYKIQNNEAFVYGLTNPNVKSVVIPKFVDKYPVTEIKHKAFSKTKVQTVTLPNSIIAIDANAFEDCANLISVIQTGTHSTRAISINEYAFFGCRRLRSLQLKHDMLLLGHKQFAFCESIVELPPIHGVSSFFDGTFYNCKNLMKIELIGSHKALIDNNTFLNCDNLKSFTFRCKIELNQYLLRTLADADIYIEPNNKNLVDLVYLGYRVHLI